MGQIKDYRWFLKHEPELYKQYGEGWMVISGMKVIDFVAERRKNKYCSMSASEKMLGLLHIWQELIPEGQYIIQEVRSPKHRKYDEEHPIHIPGSSDKDIMAGKVFDVFVKMWKQGDYVNYQSGKFFIDGAVEFDEEDFNNLAYFLEENYGEID